MFASVIVCLDFFSRMTSRVPDHYHRHSKFNPNVFNGQCGYIGGRIDIINDVDIDMFCIGDLEDYALKYNYSKNDFHNFKYNGHSFKDGIRLLYDDSSVRALTSLCLPREKIELYVDHSN